MKLFLQYLRQRRRIFIMGAVFCIIFAVSFFLYHLPIGAVIYPTLLCIAVGIVIMAFDFARVKREHEALKSIRGITDEKWLSFVIEQVLSNALKYTPTGSIRITPEPDKKLCIRDTGIGIAPEDLPRIFENGHTGYNGRSDKKASGIGLYLCKRICTNLGHSIKAESVVDEGTVITIDLAQTKLEVE